MKWRKNMFKKMFFLFTLIASLSIFVNLYAKTYEGTVSRSVKSNFPTNFVRPGVDGFNGHLTWIAPVGTFARGPVYNEKGEIIRKGDVLALCDKRFYLSYVEEAKADIKANKGVFTSAANDYKRKAKLLTGEGTKGGTPVIAKSDYDTSEATYNRALGDLKKAEENLKYQNLLLENCTIRAAYDCYIMKHVNSVGSWTNVDYPTMEVMRLSPMYIDVKMSRDEAKQIFNGNNMVNVYTKDSKKPYIAYVQYAQFTKNGIRIPVANHFSDVPENIKIPIINKYSLIRRFEIGSTKLAVSIKCIQKDKKGLYVWQAEGQQVKGNKMIDKTFKVHKKYIKTTDELRKTLPMGMIQCLKDFDNFKIRDVILEDIPKGLKDGDEVYYHKENLIFWPNDKVKVIIDS
jgi:hypothetical protein